MKKALIIFALFLGSLSFTPLMAQTTDSTTAPQWKDKIRFGGNGGFTVSNGVTVISISPLIGYQLTNELLLGVQGRYQRYSSGNFQDDRLGGSVFARYHILDEFFVQTEYESLQTTYWKEEAQQYVKDFVNSFMVGGGYFQRFSRRAGFGMSVMYIVNHNPETSPYGDSPIVVRGGFIF